MDQELYWPAAKELAERGDVETLLSRIREIADDAERISFFRFVMRKLAFGEWANKNLDVLSAVADAAIADCERLGGEYLEQANVICFNMSANLADCWGDGFAREPRHFEKGIDYAQRAIWYRERLAKGPGSMAMATWALAKHQQSLGRVNEAKANYRRTLELETQAADLSDKPAEISADAPVGYLIAAGYVALTDGDADVLRRLGAVLREMEAKGGEPKEESEIVACQLRITAEKMGIDVDFGFTGSRS